MIDKPKYKKYKNLTYDEYRYVGEHKIKMPELPDNPKEIYFIDLPQNEAFWDRDKVLPEYRDIWFKYIPYYSELNCDETKEDDKGALISLNQTDSEYILNTLEREVKKRSEGVFARIENEIVWIPGDMWFVLMWCKTKIPPIPGKKRKEYFDFRFFQLDFFYFIHHVISAEHILGGFISKPKKTGVTNLMWLIYLNRITMTRNVNMGNMNIKQDMGAKTFRDHFMYAFNGLPPILQPQVKSISEAEGSISFGKRAASRKGNATFNNSDEELGSSVMCVPCANHAFDVDVFSICWYDEPPKYINDFGEVYRSNKSGTSLQDIIVGKIFCTSYTPEDSGKSFMSARDLFFDSELGTIREGQLQTKSKLICYHIPSHQSWSSSFDKYGRCNEKDAYVKIMKERDIYKGKPKELQAEIRKYAMNKKEAWSIGGEGSLFDPIRVGELMDNIITEQREDPRGQYAPGNLRWVNEMWNINPGLRRKGEFCDVYFEPLTDDELERDEDYSTREYHPIPGDQRNFILSLGRDEWGNLNAPVEYKNILGADPTQHAAASEVIEGSTNSYIVMNRYDPLLDMRAQGVGSRMFMYEYYFRPESPDDSYEDLVKMIIYTGALCAVEANVPNCATRLISEGLGRYMIVKDLKGNPVIWDKWMGMERDDEKKYHLLRATANSKESNTVKEEFVRLHKAYIRRPYPGGKDYGATIKSERYIGDLGKIDIKDSSKKYDTFMAVGWCLWADEMYSLIKMYEQENQYSDNDIYSVLKALSPQKT